MNSSGMETAAASQQTREHQRDTPVKLGACLFFVLAVGSLLAKAHYGIAMHWLIPVGLSAAVGIGVGYWTHRWGLAISARVAEAHRAERERQQQRQIEEMQRSRRS